MTESKRWWNWGVSYEKEVARLNFTLRTLENGEWVENLEINPQLKDVVGTYFNIKLVADNYISHGTYHETIKFLETNGVKVPYAFKEFYMND